MTVLEILGLINSFEMQLASSRRVGSENALLSLNKFKKHIKRYPETNTAKDWMISACYLWQSKVQQFC